jgi:hypothetical protein
VENNAMDFLGFGDEAIAAFIVFLLGILFTIIWQRFTEKRHKVVYQVSYEPIRLSVDDRLKDRVSISFDGIDVNSIYSYTIRVVNGGNLAVNNQIIYFEFDDKAEPIGTPVVDHKPLVGPVNLIETKSSPYAVTYSIKLLAVNHKVIFHVYTKNNTTPRVKIYGRNETDQNTEFIEQSAQRIMSLSDILRRILLVTFSFLFVTFLSDTLLQVSFYMENETLALTNLQLSFVLKIILAGLFLINSYNFIREWFKSRQTHDKDEASISIPNAQFAQVIVASEGGSIHTVDQRIVPENESGKPSLAERAEILDDLEAAILQTQKDGSINKQTKAFRISKLRRIIDAIR